MDETRRGAAGPYRTWNCPLYRNTYGTAPPIVKLHYTPFLRFLKVLNILLYGSCGLHLGLPFSALNGSKNHTSKMNILGHTLTSEPSTACTCIMMASPHSHSYPHHNRHASFAPTHMGTCTCTSSHTLWCNCNRGQPESLHLQRRHNGVQQAHSHTSPACAPQRCGPCTRTLSTHLHPHFGQQASTSTRTCTYTCTDPSRRASTRACTTVAKPAPARTAPQCRRRSAARGVHILGQQHTRKGTAIDRTRSVLQPRLQDGEYVEVAVMQKGNDPAAG